MARISASAALSTVVEASSATGVEASSATGVSSISGNPSVVGLPVVVGFC
jgi:hypothetical protein